MKKFKFTLSAVHNVREMRQEKEQLVYSQLQAEAAAVAEQLTEAENKRRTTLDCYARRLASGEIVDPLEMELSAKYLLSLDRLERESKKVLAQKKQACDRQSVNVTAAHQAVKATAKIRETQVARYNLEFARTEQTNLDEITSLNYARTLFQNK